MPPKGHKRKGSVSTASGGTKKAKLSTGLAHFVRGTISKLDTLQSPSASQPLTSFFVRLPPKKAYPDYYELIQHPISLFEMNKKAESYKDTDEFWKDVEFMRDNAMTYNEASSVVVQDVLKICEVIAQDIEQYKTQIEKKEDENEGAEQKMVGSSSWIGEEQEQEQEPKEKVETPKKQPAPKIKIKINANPKPKPTPKSKPKPQPKLVSDLKPRFLTILDTLRAHQEEDTSIAETFLDEVSPEVFPDYHTIVSKPMALNTVKAKVLNNEYEALEAFTNDVDQIWKNAELYNGKDSWVAQDANTLKGVFHKLTSALSEEIKTGKTEDGVRPEFKTDEKKQQQQQAQEIPEHVAVVEEKFSVDAPVAAATTTAPAAFPPKRRGRPPKNRVIVEPEVRTPIDGDISTINAADDLDRSVRDINAQLPDLLPTDDVENSMIEQTPDLEDRTLSEVARLRKSLLSKLYPQNAIPEPSSTGLITTLSVSSSLTTYRQTIKQPTQPTFQHWFQHQFQPQPQQQTGLVNHKTITLPPNQGSITLLAKLPEWIISNSNGNGTPSGANFQTLLNVNGEKVNAIPTIVQYKKKNKSTNKTKSPEETQEEEEEEEEQRQDDDDDEAVEVRYELRLALGLNHLLFEVSYTKPKTEEDANEDEDEMRLRHGTVRDYSSMNKGTEDTSTKEQEEKEKNGALVEKMGLWIQVI